MQSLAYLGLALTVAVLLPSGYGFPREYQSPVEYDHWKSVPEKAYVGGEVEKIDYGLDYVPHHHLPVVKKHYEEPVVVVDEEYHETTVDKYPSHKVGYADSEYLDLSPGIGHKDIGLYGAEGVSKDWLNIHGGKHGEYGWPGHSKWGSEVKEIVTKEEVVETVQETVHPETVY